MNAKLAIDGGRPVRERPVPLNIPDFNEEDFASVDRAMRSTFVSGDGPECRAFERELQEYLGAKHVFFTSSCTAALDLAFMIKEFPDDAEVLVPDFTFTSSAMAPILNRLKVVLVDVNADNGNIDVAKIESKITPRTVAIVPVDYAGNPVEFAAIAEIATRHRLYVVHDTAQSIGSEYRGRRVGTLGHVSCFSFHGTKNLVVGEGGAVATDDDEIAARVMTAREKGTDKYLYLTDPSRRGFYEYVSKGNSYVQSNILGALGRSQLKRLDRMNRRRTEIAERYIEEFTHVQTLSMPRTTVGAKTNWHLFYLLVPAARKSWFIEALRAEGVIANIHYNPLHVNRFYRSVCDFQEDEFPNAMRFYDALVRIPLFSSMSDADTDDVVAAVKKVVDHAQRQGTAR